MKNPLGCLALLAVLAILFTAPHALCAAPSVTRLKPDLAHSFATVTAGQIVVGIVGEGWAIRFSLDREQQPRLSGLLHPGEVSFIRGPRLSQYIRPAAGPPTPPLPKNDAYAVTPLGTISITAIGAVNTPEPGGYLELSLSRFVVAGELFEVDGNVRLQMRGPLP
jgi:hypothetical protein